METQQEDTAVAAVHTTAATQLQVHVVATSVQPCASTSVECIQLPAALQVKGHAAPSNHLVSSYVLYVYCIFILLTEADYMLLYHILLLVFGCKFCVQQI